MAAVGTGKRNRDLLKCVGEDTGEVLQVDEKRRDLRPYIPDANPCLLRLPNHPI